LNYKIFFLLIRQRYLKKISRERFIVEWELEQKRQGITAQCGRFVRPRNRRVM
jgi:hypothetical protein